MPDFLYISCQIEAERAVKDEMARLWPDFRFAFSRPGFLTFKMPDEHGLAADFSLKSVFARAYGFSLGKISGDSSEKVAQEIWQLVPGRIFQRVHVWQRDQAVPGEHGYEPEITPEALAMRQSLLACCPTPSSLARDAADPAQPARPGDSVLDCIQVEPNLWWIGHHQADSIASRYPGGMMSLKLPEDAVSRAWLKMEEGLRWSQLPLHAGSHVAEIGSAPGGASQALLSRGLYVTGIDPAEMAPTLLGHPRFTHIRQRSTQVRRRVFRKIRWLTADMNVAPNYTLDSIEAIVTHSEVNVRGMLLTLKLPDWQLAADVPGYLARIRSWGYNLVKARQLQYDRREICVAALQKPFRKK